MSKSSAYYQIPEQQMKAITLWQPWASAVSLHQKKIETRSWYTKYRGPIAIHAAVKQSNKNRDFFCEMLWNTDAINHVSWTAICEDDFDLLPLGEVVAIARLEAVERVENVHISESERAWGDYSPGRFAWILSRIERLENPIPVQGRQGMWDFTLPARTCNRQLSLL